MGSLNVHYLHRRLLCFVIIAWTLVTLSESRSLMRIATKHCTFGMGCFWGPQAKFSKIAGVKRAIAGYTGGDNLNPTYESVCGGDGHIEAVRVEYDDTTISFDEILDVFWDQDLDSMRSQYGQYSSRIWCSDKGQRQTISERIRLLNEAGDPRAKIPVLDDEREFYVAETYHQDYLSKQSPRYLFLGVALILNLTPGLNPDIYKASAIMTCSYIAFTILERYIIGRAAKLAE